MKKIGKLLILASLLTFIMAMPVMANSDKEVTISSTNTDTLVSMIDAHNLQLLSALENVSKFASSDAAMKDAQIHMNVVYSQIRKEDQDICANHIYYLQAVVGNMTETARVKKEVLDNYTSLAAVNPTYAAMIPQAQADYNAALADVVTAQNNITIAQAKLAKYYQ